MKPIYNEDTTYNSYACHLANLLEDEGLASVVKYVKANKLDIHQLSHLLSSITCCTIAKLQMDYRLSLFKEEK